MAQVQKACMCFTIHLSKEVYASFNCSGPHSMQGEILWLLVLFAYSISCPLLRRCMISIQDVTRLDVGMLRRDAN